MQAMLVSHTPPPRHYTQAPGRPSFQGLAMSGCSLKSDQPAACQRSLDSPEVAWGRTSTTASFNSPLPRPFTPSPPSRLAKEKGLMPHCAPHPSVTHSMLQAGPVVLPAYPHTACPPQPPLVPGHVALDSPSQGCSVWGLHSLDLSGPPLPSRGDSPTKLCCGRPLLWRAQHCLGNPERQT